MSAAVDAEIAAINEFLDQPKRLRGLLPIWGKTGFSQELGASWPIEDDIGVILAQLKFRCWPSRTSYPSLNLIMRRRLVWRIDLVPPDEQKANPIWAQSFGLPGIVRGSHGHEWPDHQENVRQTGDWQLLARRPLPHNITTLEQLLPWFAGRINLELESGQRGFDVPPQSELV